MIRMLILFLQNCNFTRIYFIKTDITITMPARLIWFILKSKQLSKFHDLIMIMKSPVD